MTLRDPGGIWSGTTVGQLQSSNPGAESEMKKYILDCESVKSDSDFWDLYCEVVRPEDEGYFGRNLDAFWDAVSAGGPGWPGDCQIELVNVRGFVERNPRLYNGLKRIANDLASNAGVEIVFTDVSR